MRGGYLYISARVQDHMCHNRTRDLWLKDKSVSECVGCFWVFCWYFHFALNTPLAWKYHFGVGCRGTAVFQGVSEESGFW